MLNRIQFISFAAVGALVAFTAAITPARAVDFAQNLGPVGHHQPILTAVGSKRIIAFYVPEGGDCVVHSVVWDTIDTDADSAVGMRISLNSNQMMHIDSAEKSINLQCGDNASTLSIVGISE